MLLTALVGLAIVHLTTLRSLSEVKRQLRVRNYTLEKRKEAERRILGDEIGLLQVRNPERAYFRRLAASGGTVWQYRVYLPPNREYKLVAGHLAGPRKEVALPRGGDPDGFLVTVVFERAVGKSGYIVTGPGFTIHGDVEQNGSWVNQELTHSRQRNFDPAAGCVLFQYGSPGLFAPAVGGSARFRVWIHPRSEIPDDEGTIVRPSQLPHSP